MFYKLNLGEKSQKSFTVTNSLIFVFSIKNSNKENNNLLTIYPNIQLSQLINRKFHIFKYRLAVLTIQCGKASDKNNFQQNKHYPSKHEKSGRKLKLHNSIKKGRICHKSVLSVKLRSFKLVNSVKYVLKIIKVLELTRNPN